MTSLTQGTSAWAGLGRAIPGDGDVEGVRHVEVVEGEVIA
ncbi:hypothetical protein BH24ACT15_BH24ACT15_30500 [soil metagenome]|jgi:hypothetical protein